MARDERGLTDKQALFADAYADCLNATKAAELAGYSGDERTLGVTGCDLLKNPKVRAAANEAMAKRAMPREEIVRRLAEHVLGDMKDFTRDDGLPGLDLKKARRLGKMHLIKKYSLTRAGEQIELYDQLQALQMLGKAMGLFLDKVDVTSNGQTISFDAAVAALRAAEQGEDKVG